MIFSILNYRTHRHIYIALGIFILVLFFFPSIVPKIYAIDCNTTTIIACNTEEKKTTYFNSIFAKIQAMQSWPDQTKNNCPINDPSKRQSGQINEFYNQCWNDPYGNGVSVVEEYFSLVYTQCNCSPDSNVKDLFRSYFFSKLISSLDPTVTPPPTPTNLPTGYVPTPIPERQTPTPIPYDPDRGEHGGPCNMIDFTTGDTLGLISDGLQSIPVVGDQFGFIFNNVAETQTEIFDSVVGAFMKQPEDFNADSGSLYKYYFGCSPGNICATSRDVKKLTGIEGLQVDDVCIKQSLWMPYVNEVRKNGGKLLAQTTPTQNIPSNKTLVQVAAAPTASPVKLQPEDISQSIARMCFRSIPFAEKLGLAFLGREAPTENTIKSAYDASSGWILDREFLHKYINMPKYISSQFQDGDDGLEELKRQCSTRSSDCSVSNISSMGNLGEVVKGIPDDNYQKAGVPEKSISSFKTSMAKCIDCASRGEMTTAIGCLPVTDTSSFIAKTVFGIALGIAGSFCLLCIIYGAILIQLGGQNAKNIESGRKMISQCIIGLIIIIFSLFILRFIGVDLLRIPGLG